MSTLFIAWRNMTAQITKGSASVVINGFPAARVGDLTNGETEASVAAAVASGVAGALSSITAPLQFAAGAAMSAANGVMQIAAGDANVVSFGNTAATFQLPVVLPGGNSSTNNQAASVAYVDAHSGSSVAFPITANQGGTGANNITTTGSILVANGTAFVSMPISGDATIQANGMITVLSAGGITFGTAAFEDTGYFIANTQIGIANGVTPLGSDAKVPTSYLPASVLGQVSYQGGWDASSGSAPSATPSKGEYWIVTTAGSTSLNSITSWNVGDWAIYDVAWDKVDNTDAVSSVAGLTGVISAASLQSALGLGSAAYEDVSAFANSSQGTLASSAMQPGDAAGGDLSGTYPNPTLANTTVSAGTYGNSSAYSVFTVGADGRVTNAHSQSLPDTGQPSVVSALSISSGTVAVDCSLGDTFTLTLTSNVTTVTFSNLQASGKPTFVIIKVAQDGTGGRTITWPSGVKWSGGTAYVVSTAASAVDTVGLMTLDAGTSWQGIASKGFA